MPSKVPVLALRAMSGRTLVIGGEIRISSSAARRSKLPGIDWLLGSPPLHLQWEGSTPALSGSVLMVKTGIRATGTLTEIAWIVPSCISSIESATPDTS